jgi:hypothetical protein
LPQVGTEAIETKDDFSSVTKEEFVQATWHKADHMISLFKVTETVSLNCLVADL